MEHIGVVELLLNSKACLEAKTTTPFHDAIEAGHNGVAKLLIEFRAEVNAENSHLMWPLHCAAWMGHAGVAKLLIDTRADVDVAGNHKKTDECEVAAQPRPIEEGSRVDDSFCCYG